MTTPRLSDPPREIPAGAALAVLARREEISDSLWFFLPAAAVVGGATLDLVPGFKAFLLIVAVFLFAIGLARVLASLARSLPMLWTMRFGFLATGRIAACRFEWEGRRAEMPFAPFLSNWRGNLQQARERRATGRLLKWMFVGIALPVVLACLGFTAILLMFVFFGEPRVIERTVNVGSVTAAWAAAVVFVALLAILVLALRWRAKDEIGKYREWRRMAHGEQYDANSTELVEALRRSSEKVQLSAPLPTDGAHVELICRVEYMARGERATAEGRVPLCDRLDLQGVEALLFRPSRPGRVLFLADLPARASAGAWQDMPLGPSAASLAPPVLVAGATVAGFIHYLPVVVALLR